MSESIFTKAKNFPWKKAIKRLLFETPVEVMIGVLIAGIIAGPLIYRNRAARSGEIPTAFSEIEQTTKDFAKQGKPVPPNTKYYSYANDIPAKVFESSNIAFHLGDSHKVFASELQTRVNANYQKHPLLSTYAEEMPQVASDALKSMHKLVDAANQLPAIRQAFEDAWGEDHDHHYKTKRWTTRECNSEGKNCRTVNHSKRVHDYTIHTYTFHPEAAQRAARLLNDFVARNPDLTVEEKFYLARETHAENEEAIAKSMKRQLDGKTPTSEEFTKLANTWASGSNLAKYQPGIETSYTELRGILSRWNKALPGAKNVRTRSSSMTDSGPYEYRLAESAKDYGASVESSSHHVIDGIRFTQTQATVLNAQIKEYVGVVLEGKPGDADQLRANLMKTARQIYWQNYENGFDVQPFKWLEVILLTMLCMAAGGAAGFGVDRLLNARRREWYDNDDSEDDTRRHRDVDADFNRRSEMPWTRQPEPQSPPVKTEPEPLPAPEKASGWNWTPKPPAGVDVSPPLPESGKTPGETQGAGNDNAEGVKDDPAKREKWIKKYKDISP
jgi:hypothetical protein